MEAKEREEERMWCGHCGVHSLLRRHGNGCSVVKACEGCGKVLADESGTAEEFNLLFRIQNEATISEETKPSTNTSHL